MRFAGVFFERFSTTGYNIEQRTFAHRFYHKVIVTQLYVQPTTKDKTAALEITVLSNTGNSSDDISFDAETEYESLYPATYQCGKTAQVEDPFYQTTNPTACVIASQVCVLCSLSVKTLLKF